MSEPSLVPVASGLLKALASEVPQPAASPQSSAARNGTYDSRLLVERWLGDRSVAFRRKAEADRKGRTVYVLKVCPFESGHGDPDSCVMQAPDGKLSAQCFHDSCKGRGWQQFKEAIGPPEAHHYDPPLDGCKQKTKKSAASRRAQVAGPSTAADPPGDASPKTSTAPTGQASDELPEIRGNKRQLRSVTRDALDALLKRNNPPTVFQRGGLLTRLRFDPEGGVPLLEPLTDAAVRGVLARSANWIKVKDTKEGAIDEEDAPPLEVVKDLASLPAWEGIPNLRAVVEVPVFTPAGLIAQQGYHAEAGLWYQPAPGLEILTVADQPDAGDIEWARDFLLVELLGDFPFRDNASRAHALAALLLPFVRPLIDGSTPLHLIDAPVEGTGKTLLATVIALVATGRAAEAIAEGSCEEEWRKRITAVLAEGPQFVLLDNLSRVLDSGALAAALTAQVWKDRILGSSKTARLPVRCIWLGSGNNTCLSREMARRTLWCRLDAHVDVPWERKDFRHADLIGWAKENRNRLVAAALTLCRAWLATGKPRGSATLGMFESWAAVIGGILDVAGVPGLLGNAAELRTTRADQVAEWRAFVAAWWREFSEKAVGVTELFDLATREKLLDEVLGDKGDRSQRTRLGKALGRSADRIFGGYCLERDQEDNCGRQQYRLRPLSDTSSQADTRIMG
jgi:hypothetical protein